MTTGFRHGDPRFPFLWESEHQPAARWHATGEGPAHYFADTPDGAWAEFLRHEEITDPADLDGVARRLWVVELPDAALADAAVVQLPGAVTRGGLDTYARCRLEARRLRASGASALVAPSAALPAGAARGQRVAGGLLEGEPRDGHVWVLFGSRPDLRGWAAVDVGAPTERVLGLVSHLDQPDE